MKGCCYYCEIPFTKHKLFPGELSMTDNIQATKDHIIPVSRGGKNTAKNYVKACNSCNTKKSGWMPEEFLQGLKSGLIKGLSGGKRDIVIANVEKLIETITPYRIELFKPGYAEVAGFKGEAEDVGWPDADPELIQAFDWSKPFETAKPHKPKKERIGRYSEIAETGIGIDPKIQAIADQVRTGANSFPSFRAKFAKKFPYAFSMFEEAGPDLLRWTFDNIKNSKI